MAQIVKCSLCIVWTSPSVRRCVSCGHKHVRIFKTYIQATKVIFVFSLVGSLGLYMFLKHNSYLFIDCSIENGFAVVYWRGGEW